MAEVLAVTAARAAVLRNDTRNLRRQELRNAERLQQERQADLDKRPASLRTSCRSTGAGSIPAATT